MRLRIPRIRIEWERVHFCKDDKVRYRKHLTGGMIVATILTMTGIGFGIEWLGHFSALANMVTAIMWIWE